MTTLPEICPKCGSETIYGYGLMGGGIGAYVVCGAVDLNGNECDFFSKAQDKDERPQTQDKKSETK